jgi:hypothetical protein
VSYLCNEFRKQTTQSKSLITVTIFIIISCLGTPTPLQAHFLGTIVHPGVQNDFHTYSFNMDFFFLGGTGL